MGCKGRWGGGDGAGQEGKKCRGALCPNSGGTLCPAVRAAAGQSAAAQVTAHHNTALHLDLAHGAGHNGLQHCAAVVVQQVDLINDDQPHQLRVGAVAWAQGGRWGWGEGSGPA